MNNRSSLKKIFSTLAVIITFFTVYPFSPVHGEEPKGGLFYPESSALVYAYGGYGYYNWKMMSINGLVDTFSSGSDVPTSGIRFRHEATPYTLKKYGFRTNFFIVSMGLDYFSDRFSLPGEFSSGDNETDTEDKNAKQLRYLSGLKFGNVSLQFNILKREFDSSIESKGFKPLMSSTLYPVYYYMRDGSSLQLADGDKTSWFTEYTEYEAKVEIQSRYTILEIGGKYVKYDAPSEMKIKYNYIDGDILMFMENRMMSLFFGMKTLYPLGSNFYLGFHIPVNIVGYYYPESEYFEIKDKKPFSANTFSMAVSSSGNISLQYILSHVKIAGGFDYGMYYSKLMLQNAELKKDIEYRDNAYGNIYTAPSGSNVDIEATRIEFFWGLYLHASIFF